MSTDPRPYRRTAPHIRGRVFRIGPSSVAGLTRWGMEVINTHTGKVIASDNCTRLATLISAADETTAAARAAWFWNFKRKDVQ